MANPSKYTQGYDFSGFQDGNPATPIPADRLDTELANISASTEELRDAIMDVRRADGGLKNRIVTRESLSSNLLALTGADTGDWVTATAYVVGDLATSGGRQYQCIVAHTAGVFATDLAAGKWALTAAESSEDAAASAAAAAASAASVPAFSVFWQTIVGAASAAASWLLLLVLGHLTTRTSIKALVPSAGMAVYLSEAGREGTFVWRTGDYSALVTADTQEGVYLKADSVASSSGAWVRSASSEFDVRWFGAVGDGVNDAATAIQAALTFAATIVSNVLTSKVDTVTASVRLPAGRYVTSAAITVGEGTRFFGDGPGVSVIAPTHSGNAIEMGGTGREYSNIEVDHLSVEGAYTGSLSFGSWTPTSAIGIRAQKCIRGCSIHHTEVSKFQINYRITDSYQFSLHYNYGLYATQNNVRTNNMTASSICFNRFDWAEQNGVFVDNSPLASDETIGLLIQGNAIQINWRNGILLYDVQAATVANNHFEANYMSATAATYTYADLAILEGPNNGGRGLEFTVRDNFFTSGSAPDEDVFTAIRCDRAKVINIYGNKCRDSLYYMFADLNDSAVEEINAWGNALTASLNSRFNYASSSAKGLIADGPDGIGSYRIVDLLANSVKVQSVVSSSNQTTDGFHTVYLIDCSGGNRQITLADADCVAGRVFFLQKTSGGANQLIATRPAAGSTKTVNGATSINTTTAYGAMVVFSDGSNWFALKV